MKINVLIITGQVPCLVVLPPAGDGGSPAS